MFLWEQPPLPGGHCREKLVGGVSSLFSPLCVQTSRTMFRHRNQKPRAVTPISGLLQTHHLTPGMFPLLLRLLHQNRTVQGILLAERQGHVCSRKPVVSECDPGRHPGQLDLHGHWVPPAARSVDENRRSLQPYIHRCFLHWDAAQSLRFRCIRIHQGAPQSVWRSHCCRQRFWNSERCWLFWHLRAQDVQTTEAYQAVSVHTHVEAADRCYDKDAW